MTAELVQLMPVELCGREPLSCRDLADELGGSQTSGHQRNNVLKEVEGALARFYEVAREVVDTDEQAAVLVLRMVARDPDFEVPEWCVELFAAHREGLEETFHDPNRGDRTTEYGFDHFRGEREEPKARLVPSEGDKNTKHADRTRRNAAIAAKLASGTKWNAITAEFAVSRCTVARVRKSLPSREAEQHRPRASNQRQAAE